MEIYREATLRSMKLFYGKLFFCSLISFVFFYSATAQNNQEPKTLLPPVETQSPVSKGQRPAFKVQTRIGGVKTRSKIKITSIADGLKCPWGLDFMPDGRMIVTEKPGNIRIVSKEGVVGANIRGVPAVRLKGDGGV